MSDGQTDGHIVSDEQTDIMCRKDRPTDRGKVLKSHAFLSCIFTQIALKHALGDLEPIGTLAMQIKPKLRD